MRKRTFFSDKRCIERHWIRADYGKWLLKRFKLGRNQKSMCRKSKCYRYKSKKECRSGQCNFNGIKLRKRKLCCNYGRWPSALALRYFETLWRNKKRLWCVLCKFCTQKTKTLEKSRKLFQRENKSDFYRKAKRYLSFSF